MQTSRTLALFWLMTVAILVLVGCTSTTEPAPVIEGATSTTQEAQANSTEKLILSAEDLLLTDSDNSVIAACNAYEFQGSSDFVVAYELLIEDMCSQGELDSSLLDLRVGENILDKPIGFYVDAVLFHLNYFDSIAEGGIDPVPMLVVSEFDKEFWQTELEALLTIDFEWANPSDAGGHCGYRFEGEAFCPNIYIPGETVADNGILTLFLGEEEVLRDHDTWRKSIPAHSALHAVQYGKKMTHFTQWVIEGQALLHELAYQQLMDGQTVRFSKYLPMAVSQAPRKLDPSSEETIRAHIADCVLYGSECLDFHSFSGSIYLEKLILDFGVEKYRDFFRQIWSADDLGISPVEVWEFYAGEVFVDVYGIDLESWLDEVGIPYLASVYAGAGY